MDPIKAYKIPAVMKNYKKAQFLYNFIVYSLTAFLSCLFYLYLFWFPANSMKHFFCIFHPNIYSFFSSPKFLFIVGNIIVLFLVGESKLGRRSSGSSPGPAAEIYTEYVQRSQSLRQRSRVLVEYKKIREKKPEIHMHIITTTSMSIILDDEKTSACHENEKKAESMEQTISNNGETISKVDTMEEKLVGGGEEEVEEQLVVLPKDELNRRVEEFIARVNRQRRLEGKTSGRSLVK